MQTALAEPVEVSVGAEVADFWSPEAVFKGQRSKVCVVPFEGYFDS